MIKDDMSNDDDGIVSVQGRFHIK